ncbi:MAG TPA: NUDIX domain-containing protein [Candidatus Saccharimonadales bacterium]|nr:NUDIX domain-containing protein [Candidatus Saccharimonadales bacterium]
MSAPIMIVDDHDRPIGAATKQQAWQQGLWHRVVRIVLEDGHGKVLLQHRSPTKDIYPNCWDNAAAGHVDAGEDYDTAAYRELREELGLADLTLEKVGQYRHRGVWHGLLMNRFVAIYRSTIAVTPESHEPHKIDAVRWFTIEEIKRLLEEHPTQVADGLVEVFVQLYGGK